MVICNTFLDVAIVQSQFLVPGLCLGTHCSRGSASLRNASETRMLDDSAGRACKSVGSKAEPWNQSGPGTSRPVGGDQREVSNFRIFFAKQKTRQKKAKVICNTFLDVAIVQPVSKRKRGCIH